MFETRMFKHFSCACMMVVVLFLWGCSKDSTELVKPSGSSSTPSTPPVLVPTAVTPVDISNKGISGDNTADLLKRIKKDVIDLKPDLVILMVGTNDVRTVGKMLSLDQYRSNLEDLIKQVKNENIDLLLLSPPPVGTQTLVYPNDVNQKIDAVAVAMEDLASKYGCYYSNVNKAFKDAGSPNSTEQSMINNAANTPLHPDGLHLTPNGNRFIATLVTDLIKKTIRKQYSKVVCFGDSLTYGLYDDGAGSVSGKTYPAYLMGLLN